MSTSLNTFAIIGNVGSDAPAPRYTPTGKSVTDFNVGVSYKDQTEWVKVTCWDKLAEIAAQYVRKGAQIYIEGSAGVECWADKQTGEPRARLTLRANTLKLLGKRGDTDQQPDGPAPGVAFNDFDNSEYDAPLPPLSHGD